MADTLANDIIARENDLRGQRAAFEAMWAEIAQHLDPLSPFNGCDDPVRGRLGKVFNSKPQLALERGAAAAMSLLIPAGDMWHGLKPIDDNLVDNKEVSDYCEVLRKRLFAWRYDARAGFQGTFGPAYREMMAYGTPVVHIEERFGFDAPFLYRFVPLSEVVFSVDETNITDTVFRTYHMSAKQMAQKFGENKLSQAAKRCLDDKKSRGETQFKVIHGVYPAVSGKSRFPFDQIYVECEGGQILAQGGAYEMPYMTSSFGRVDPKLPYGYSCGLRALSDIKGANHARRLFLRAAEKNIDPPQMVDDEFQGVLSLNAGAMVRGALRGDRQLIKPMQVGGNPSLGSDVFEMYANDINASFYLDLFAAIMKKTDMSATEVLSVMEERANLLSPPFAQQEAMLARCISREISIINRKAENKEITLPAMPEVLRKAGGVDLEFTSPLSQLRKAKRAQANLQAVQSIAQIAKLDPTVLDAIDFDALAYESASAFGASSSIWRDAKEVSQLRQSRAKNQQRESEEAEKQTRIDQIASLSPTLKILREKVDKNQ